MEGVRPFFSVFVRPCRLVVLENWVLEDPDALVQNRLLQIVKALGTSFSFWHEYSDPPDLWVIDPDHHILR